MRGSRASPLGSAWLAHGSFVPYAARVTPFRPLPPPPPPFAPSRGEQHLGQLAIGYYVLGALFVPVALLFLVYVGFGIAVLNGTFNDGSTPPPPEIMGWVFLGVGLFAFAIGASMAAVTVYGGRCIAQRKNLTFVYILAGILCMNMPLGTVLGVLTFVVLSNDHTKSLFRAST